MRYIQLLLILFLLLGGCNSFIQRHNPQPEDTKFDESKRDWIAVFEHEIKVAMDNEDEEAYHFFMRELLVEKVRRWKEKQKAKQQ
jgi:hypothetical protein